MLYHLTNDLCRHCGERMTSHASMTYACPIKGKNQFNKKRKFASGRIYLTVKEVKKIFDALDPYFESKRLLEKKLRRFLAGEECR